METPDISLRRFVTCEMCEKHFEITTQRISITTKGRAKVTCPTCGEHTTTDIPREIMQKIERLHLPPGQKYRRNPKGRSDRGEFRNSTHVD